MRRTRRWGSGDGRASAAIATHGDDAIGSAHSDASEAQNFATIFCQRDMRTITLEQTHTEIFLQLAQLNTQCGLSDGAALRRASEIETFSESKEVA